MRPDLHLGVQLAVGSILGLLLFATVTTSVLVRLRPALDLDEVQTRIRSWWVIAGLFSLAIVLERGWGLFFFAGVSYLALKEYLSLIPTRRAD